MSTDICDPAVTASNAAANGIRQHSEFKLEEIATSVEERPDGWWLVIKRMGLGLWLGTEKPAIESGDLLSIRITKKERPHVQT